MKKSQIITAAALLIMTACGTNNATQKKIDITGEWNIVEVNGNAVPETPEAPTINFNEETHTFFSSTGVNELSGSYILKNDTLVFLEGAITEMAADSISMAFESDYLHTIGHVRTVSSGNGSLSLKDDNGSTIILLKK